MQKQKTSYVLIMEHFAALIILKLARKYLQKVMEKEKQFLKIHKSHVCTWPSAIFKYICVESMRIYDNSY